MLKVIPEDVGTFSTQENPILRTLTVLIIASSDDPEAQEVASAELRRHTAEYRRIKRQFNQERCDGWSRD